MLLKVISMGLLNEVTFKNIYLKSFSFSKHSYGTKDFGFGSQFHNLPPVSDSDLVQHSDFINVTKDNRL